MRSKSWLNLFAALLVVALSCAAASAQVATGSGKVMLKQADGTTVPVQGATVKFFRTDINQEFSAKTDKNGRYVNVGLPLVGTYTIAVSAPGARPDYRAGIRISQQPENDFTLEPGGGEVLTLDQIKNARNAVATGAVNTEEAKKKMAEAEKERARIEEENRKAVELNAKLPEILKAGNSALMAKNYDEAVTQYNLGIQADPSQSVFYRNKAVALRARGVDKYNAGIKAKDNAVKDAARGDFKESAESAEKAVTAFREGASKRGAAGAPAAGQPAEEVGYLFDRAESYRIALQTAAPIDYEAAVKAIQEYISAETDQAKKDKAQASLGDALFYSNRLDEAVAAYRAALAANANNLDAMYGLGFALAAQDPSKYGEARDMLQQFVSKAPDTHPRKQDAADSIKYLDETLKSASSKQETDTKKGPTRRKP
ncbi:MAG TPA: carboxypeptidase-like regulatory domain-containing protein [Pyrinomonadaceae bacterium]